MRTTYLVFTATLLVVTGACIKKVESESRDKAIAASAAAVDSAGVLIYPGEKHLANVKQLTFGGQNAEAYFNRDCSELIFQSTRDNRECDAIYRMNIDGTNVRMMSSGKGTTTCSYVAPDGRSIIYASTHAGGESCPPRPDMSHGYTWAIYADYDIYTASPDGTNPVKLTNSPGYDAECVYSYQGDKILFTSLRSGDLEIYLMNPDGSQVEQLTNEDGYDGGAFFSLDGQSICWRASRPKDSALTDYKNLLAMNLVRPSKLEIYVMNLKDRQPIKLTSLNAGSFGPYFHPDGKRIIFASNYNDPKGRNFDLYMVDIATKEIEQITYNPSFDGFPMFSHDGKRLVFASNRNGKVRGETNIFIADWAE
jgi:TolB protein